MNILFITGAYPSVGYKTITTKVGHNWAKKWVEQGHNVAVVCNRRYFFTRHPIEVVNEHSEVIELDGVHIIELSSRSYIPKSDYMFPVTINNAVNKAQRKLDELSFVPDIAIVDFCAPLWRFAKKLCAPSGCNIVPIFHRCDLKEKWAVREILSDAQIVGVRSATIARTVRELAPQVKIFHAKSGAVDDISITREQCAEKMNREQHELLYVGSFDGCKNVDITVRALGELRDRYSFSFTIIGKGQNEPMLRELVAEMGLEDRVTFHEWMPREQVMEYMQRSDCFIMPSGNETFGIVYVEAMASGCYTIGSRGEGIDGTIVDGHNGALVQVGSVQSLVEALERYFNYTPEQRMEIIDNALRETQNESEAAAELLAFALGEKSPDMIVQ